LAIMKIENPQKEFSVLPMIEDEKYINIWQFAIAIGNPLWEFQNSVSFWVISGKNRSIEAQWASFWTEKLNGLLQTDAAINPWNSWGPLLNLNGEIVGINTAIAWNSQWLGFSIPLSKRRIDYILKSIETSGKIKSPFIGIWYIPINEQTQQELWLKVNYWAYISKESGWITHGSIAEKSGVTIGDIILEIENIKITYTNTIPSIIQNKIPWDTIQMKVLKENGEEKNLSIELWEK
jgi:serine protease Do